MMTATGVTQIIDFGISQIVDVKGFTTGFNCNARYSAPELMPIELEEEGKESVIRPTFMSDAFSLAMTILEVTADCRYS
jgi:serine/threonine protein kinase